MLYVLRNVQGAIKAVSEESISADWQAVSLDDKDLHTFLNNNPSYGSKLMDAVDSDFIRVLEDIVDLLVSKDLFQFTELPTSAQAKLLNRKQYRQELGGGCDTTLLLENDKGGIPL